MTPTETRIAISNLRDSYERRIDEATEAAFMFEAAANGEGVGRETQAKCLEFATAKATQAQRYKRMTEALTVALDFIPEMETV